MFTISFTITDKGKEYLFLRVITEEKTISFFFKIHLTKMLINLITNLIKIMKLENINVSKLHADMKMYKHNKWGNYKQINISRTRDVR